LKAAQFLKLRSRKHFYNKNI